MKFPTDAEDSSYATAQRFARYMRELQYERIAGIDGLVPRGLSEDDLDYWREKTRIRRRKLAYQARTK